MQRPKKRKLVHGCTEADSTARLKHRQPQCTEPDCKTWQFYIKGGVQGKCRKHGGFHNAPNPTASRGKSTIRKGVSEGNARATAVFHGAPNPTAKHFNTT